MGWIKARWKYVLVAVLIAGAFLGGRFSTPEKVKTVTQTVTVKSNETLNKDIKVEQNTVYKYVDRPVDHIITRTVIKEPSGKVTETVIDNTHQGNTEVLGKETIKKEVEIQIKKEIVYQDRIVEKVVENDNKKLDFGINLGYSIFTKDETNLIPSLPKRMVVGGYATYKVGEVFKLPIKLGIDVTSRGDLGITLGVNF